MTEPTTTATTYRPLVGDGPRRLAAETAYRRLADAFGSLPDEAWAAPTPCDGWSVRHLGGHLVGAMRSAASLRETASQQRATARRMKQTGELVVDALTAIQIERAADLTPAQVAAELDRLVGPATAGRWRLPGLVRRTASIRVQLGDIDERWTFDHFLGIILTRDAWLHRIDLADALGEPPDLDEHDGQIVGDVACDWADRHGRPVELRLTGPAGGTLRREGDGAAEVLELDAVEFCRVLSGRSQPTHPLLAVPVPF